LVANQAEISFLDQNGLTVNNQKEIRLSLADAKNLALTLGQVNSRLLGDMERFLADNTAKAQNEVVEVEMDGGGFKD